MTDKHPGKEWIHGLLAISASLLLLAAAPQRHVFRGGVDLLGEILKYPEYPAVALGNAVRSFSFWFTERREIQKRLETLEEENVHLRLAWTMGAAFRVKQDLERLPGYARVTLREPLSWWSEVRIGKGSGDGVSFGAPVLQNGFLAGRVSSAESSHSWVELITSSSLMVPVVIEETRDLGVVAGDGEGGVWLLYIPEGRPLGEGMKISTAMVSEALPPGIPIGTLSPESKKTGGGYLSWRVVPGASLSQLYALEVLRSPLGTIPVQPGAADNSPGTRYGTAVSP